jgi:hypothetical protein
MGNMPQVRARKGSTVPEVRTSQDQILPEVFPVRAQVGSESNEEYG